MTTPGRGGVGETELLVAGVAIATAGLLASLAIVVASELASSIGRGRRMRESPPARGSVPAERHRQIESAAAR